jgi:hypothetical protein
MARGAGIGMGFGKSIPPAYRRMTNPVPEYHFGMGDADAFVGRIWRLCGFSIGAYLSPMNESAKDALIHCNEESAKWRL